MACPSFSLSLLFVPLGAVLCLLRLLGFQCNIHAPADFLKLGNLGAGLFQRVIFRFPLCFEVSIFCVSYSGFLYRQGSGVAIWASVYNCSNHAGI